jgi:hypothetical protein
MFVEFKHGSQERFPAWENIVLIEAETEAEAWAKAEEHGRLDEGDDEGSFRWGKKPARWVFAGVRKLTECPTITGRPDDDSEITWNELELDSREAVDKLAAGEPVRVQFNDRYRRPQREQIRRTEAVKRRKGTRA